MFCAKSKSIPPAQIPDVPHVFSMSCKVTAVNGDLATPEGREKAIAWWRKNGFTKLWLESYRHGEHVPTERGPFAMGADGVSTHEFRKNGRRYIARLNTTDQPVAGLPPHGFELKG